MQDNGGGIIIIFFIIIIIIIIVIVGVRRAGAGFAEEEREEDQITATKPLLQTRQTCGGAAPITLGAAGAGVATRTTPVGGTPSS